MSRSIVVSLLSILFSAPAWAVTTLTGTVTDQATSDPVQGATVYVVDHSSSGLFPDLSAVTDAAGFFSIQIPESGQVQKCVFNSCFFPSVQFPGTNVGLEVASSSYLPGRYATTGTNPVTCYFGCDRALTNTGPAEEDILLPSGDVTIPDLDIALSQGPGTAFSGTVTDAQTGAPLAGAAVVPQTLDGSLFNGVAAISDAAGQFSTFLLGPVGDTYLKASSLGYASQAHNGALCDSLSLTCFAEDPVGPGPVAFSLQPESRMVISPPVVPAYVDLSISPFYAYQARIFDAFGSIIERCNWSSSDPMPFVPCDVAGLAGGAYKVMFQSSHFGAADRQDNIASVRQFHDGTQTACGSFSLDVFLIEPFFVGQGATRNLAFPTLQQGQYVRGTILDETGNAPPVAAPFSFGEFELVDTDTLRSGGIVYAAHDGTEMRLNGSCAAPAPGTYYLRSYSSISNESVSDLGVPAIDAAVENVVCAGQQCPLAQAGVVAPGDEITMTVVTGGETISGCLFDGPGVPVGENELNNLDVWIYTASGELAEKATAFMDNGTVCYRTARLPQGQYVVRATAGTIEPFPLRSATAASDRSPFFDQVLGETGNCSGDPCVGPGSATVSLNGSGDLVNQDLTLDRGSVIRGKLIDGSTRRLLTVPRGGVRVSRASDSALIGEYVAQNDGVFQTVALSDGDYVVEVISAGALLFDVAPKSAQKGQQTGIPVTIAGSTVELGSLLVRGQPFKNGFE